jgi:hypothetical protein
MIDGHLNSGSEFGVAHVLDGRGGKILGLERFLTLWAVIPLCLAGLILFSTNAEAAGSVVAGPEFPSRSPSTSSVSQRI